MSSNSKKKKAQQSTGTSTRDGSFPPPKVLEPIQRSSTTATATPSQARSVRGNHSTATSPQQRHSDLTSANTTTTTTTTTTAPGDSTLFGLIKKQNKYALGYNTDVPPPLMQASAIGVPSNKLCRLTDRDTSDKLLRALHRTFPIPEFDEEVEVDRKPPFRTAFSAVKNLPTRGNHPTVVGGGGGATTTASGASPSPKQRRSRKLGVGRGEYVEDEEQEQQEEGDVEEEEEDDVLPYIAFGDIPIVRNVRSISPQGRGQQDQKRKKPPPKKPLYVKMAERWESLEEEVFARERQYRASKKHAQEVRLNNRRQRLNMENNESTSRKDFNQSERQKRRSLREMADASMSEIEELERHRRCLRQEYERELQQKAKERAAHEALLNRQQVVREKAERVVELEKVKYGREEQVGRAKILTLEGEGAAKATRRELMRLHLETEAAEDTRAMEAQQAMQERLARERLEQEQRAQTRELEDSEQQRRSEDVEERETSERRALREEQLAEAEGIAQRPQEPAAEEEEEKEEKEEAEAEAEAEAEEKKEPEQQQQPHEEEKEEENAPAVASEEQSEEQEETKVPQEPEAEKKEEEKEQEKESTEEQRTAEPTPQEEQQAEEQQHEREEEPTDKQEEEPVDTTTASLEEEEEKAVVETQEIPPPAEEQRGRDEEHEEPATEETVKSFLDSLFLTVEKETQEEEEEAQEEADAVTQPRAAETPSADAAPATEEAERGREDEPTEKEQLEEEGKRNIPAQQPAQEEPTAQTDEQKEEAATQEEQEAETIKQGEEHDAEAPATEQQQQQRLQQQRRQQQRRQQQRRQQEEEEQQQRQQREKEEQQQRQQREEEEQQQRLQQEEKEQQQRRQQEEKEQQQRRQQEEEERRQRRQREREEQQMRLQQEEEEQQQRQQREKEEQQQRLQQEEEEQQQRLQQEEEEQQQRLQQEEEEQQQRLQQEEEEQQQRMQQEEEEQRQRQQREKEQRQRLQQEEEEQQQRLQQEEEEQQQQQRLQQEKEEQQQLLQQEEEEQQQRLQQEEEEQQRQRQQEKEEQQRQRQQEKEQRQRLQQEEEEQQQRLQQEEEEQQQRLQQEEKEQRQRRQREKEEQQQRLHQEEEEEQQRRQLEEEEQQQQLPLVHLLYRTSLVAEAHYEQDDAAPPPPSQEQEKAIIVLKARPFASVLAPTLQPRTTAAQQQQQQQQQQQPAPRSYLWTCMRSAVQRASSLPRRQSCGDAFFPFTAMLLSHQATDTHSRVKRKEQELEQQDEQQDQEQEEVLFAAQMNVYSTQLWVKEVRVSLASGQQPSDTLHYCALSATESEAQQRDVQEPSSTRVGERTLVLRKNSSSSGNTEKGEAARLNDRYWTLGEAVAASRRVELRVCAETEPGERNVSLSLDLLNLDFEDTVECAKRVCVSFLPRLFIESEEAAVRQVQQQQQQQRPLSATPSKAAASTTPTTATTQQGTLDVTSGNAGDEHQISQQQQQHGTSSQLRNVSRVQVLPGIVVSRHPSCDFCSTPTPVAIILAHETTLAVSVAAGPLVESADEWVIDLHAGGFSSSYSLTRRRASVTTSANPNPSEDATTAAPSCIRSLTHKSAITRQYLLLAAGQQAPVAALTVSPTAIQAVVFHSHHHHHHQHSHHHRGSSSIKSPATAATIASTTGPAATVAELIECITRSIFRKIVDRSDGRQLNFTVSVSTHEGAVTTALQKRYELLFVAAKYLPTFPATALIYRPTTGGNDLLVCRDYVHTVTSGFDAEARIEFELLAAENDRGEKQQQQGHGDDATAPPSFLAHDSISLECANSEEFEVAGHYLTYKRSRERIAKLEHADPHRVVLVTRRQWSEHETRAVFSVLALKCDRQSPYGIRTVSLRCGADAEAHLLVAVAPPFLEFTKITTKHVLVGETTAIGGSFKPPADIVTLLEHENRSSLHQPPEEQELERAQTDDKSSVVQPITEASIAPFLFVSMAVSDDDRKQSELPALTVVPPLRISSATLPAPSDSTTGDSATAATIKKLYHDPSLVVAKDKDKGNTTASAASPTGDSAPATTATATDGAATCMCIGTIETSEETAVGTATRFCVIKLQRDVLFLRPQILADVYNSLAVTATALGVYTVHCAVSEQHSQIKSTQSLELGVVCYTSTPNPVAVLPCPNLKYRQGSKNAERFVMFPGVRVALPEDRVFTSMEIALELIAGGLGDGGEDVLDFLTPTAQDERYREADLSANRGADADITSPISPSSLSFNQSLSLTVFSPLITSPSATPTMTPTMTPTTTNAIPSSPEEPSSGTVTPAASPATAAPQQQYVLRVVDKTLCLNDRQVGQFEYPSGSNNCSNLTIQLKSQQQPQQDQQAAAAVQSPPLVAEELSYILSCITYKNNDPKLKLGRRLFQLKLSSGSTLASRAPDDSSRVKLNIDVAPPIMAVPGFASKVMCSSHSMIASLNQKMIVNVLDSDAVSLKWIQVRVVEGAVYGAKEDHFFLNAVDLDLSHGGVSHGGTRLGKVVPGEASVAIVFDPDVKISGKILGLLLRSFAYENKGTSHSSENRLVEFGVCETNGDQCFATMTVGIHVKDLPAVIEIPKQQQKVSYVMNESLMAIAAGATIERFEATEGKSELRVEFLQQHLAPDTLVLDVLPTTAATATATATASDDATATISSPVDNIRLHNNTQIFAGDVDIGQVTTSKKQAGAGSAVSISFNNNNATCQHITQVMRMVKFKHAGRRDRQTMKKVNFSFRPKETMPWARATVAISMHEACLDISAVPQATCRTGGVPTALLVAGGGGSDHAAAAAFKLSNVERYANARITVRQLDQIPSAQKQQESAAYMSENKHSSTSVSKLDPIERNQFAFVVMNTKQIKIAEQGNGVVLFDNRQHIATWVEAAAAASEAAGTGDQAEPTTAKKKATELTLVCTSTCIASHVTALLKAVAVEYGEEDRGGGGRRAVDLHLLADVSITIADVGTTSSICHFTLAL